jgi:acetyl esterase/lipase
MSLSRRTVPNCPDYYRRALSFYLCILAAKGEGNGRSVVVAPGGGHSQLVIDKEGWQIADWLNNNGIEAFVLNYRLARAPARTTRCKATLLPMQHAPRVWFEAGLANGDWANKIGFMGLSAGCEVAALIETRFDTGSARRIRCG